METLEEQKQLATSWFRDLRDAICQEFEKIEIDSGNSSKFDRKKMGKG